MPTSIVPPRLETTNRRSLSSGIAPIDIATRPSLPKTSIEPRSRYTCSRTRPFSGFKGALTPLQVSSCFAMS